jgi:(p)ppGpp synthase/HD superfamily hydrolase
MKDREIVLRPAVEICSEVDVFRVGKSERVIMALEVAEVIHKGDRRKVSGEPYVNHCVAVASILEKWGMKMRWWRGCCMIRGKITQI